MTITFSPHKPPTDDALIDVLLGPIQHGIIQRTEDGDYRYYRLTGGRPILRHKSNDLESLKEMIKDVA